jgi:TonB family protein
MNTLTKFSWKLKISALSVLSVMAGAAFAGDAPPAYNKTVMVAVSGKVEYPKMAKMRHQEGVVTVAVTVDASGAGAGTIEKSSGIQSLDDAALAAVAAAAPFPAPPEAGTVVHGNIRFASE